MKYLLFILIFHFYFQFGYSQIVDDKTGDNGKQGFIDKTGNWVVQPIYYWTHWNANGQYGTFNETSFEKGGAVDRWGNVVIPCIYKDIYMSYDKELKQYTVKLQKEEGGKELCGVYEEKNWKEIIPVEYENIFKDSGKYRCEKDGKSGYLDINGKIIVPIEYDEVCYYLKKGYVVSKGGKKGFLDEQGKSIIPVGKYDGIYREENYITVYKNENKGFCDFKGNELLSPSCGYGERSDIAGNNIFLVEKNGKFGYYANGQEIIPCQYDDATKFTNDVATVKKDGQVKLIKNPLKDGSQIQIAENINASNKKKIGGPAISRYPAPNSDVDKDIPVVKLVNDNMFVFIIANENYPDAPVPYSLNDGRMFKEYCNKTLGVPEKNISMYEDATYGNIIAAVEKMKSIADAYDGEASIIFYYAGHGFPDEKQNTAYLLPVDGNASDITTTGYSLAKLYKDLAALKLKLSVVFLDACFSGAKREDNMLASSRGVAIKVKDEAPQGNMVVFSAAQADETAHQLEEKGHGLFTYYLLKGLQQTEGNITLGELSDIVIRQVKRQSVVINNKKQTPTVIPSQAVINSWQSLKLK